MLAMFDNIQRMMIRLRVAPALFRKLLLEYSIGNGQLSDVTYSTHEMGRYLANAIFSDKSK